MTRREPLTRAERRERAAARPVVGVYGVDALDAGADGWNGRYLCWAATQVEADERVRAAGFRRRDVQRRWSPSSPPPEGVPERLQPGVASWFASRQDDAGWTAWHELPAGYRHPSQRLAALDPEVRHRYW